MDRILIADDDIIDRKLLETYLQSLDYEIISTEDGIEAWEVIEKSETPPNIVIIDWLMPGMDGITLCEKIRAKKSTHYIYIILVTAKSMSQDMVQGLEAGADDYLTKPYEKSVLLARINVGKRIVNLEREKNEQLKKIRSTNRKLRQNMESAVQIQLSLLPPREFTINDYAFNWFFKPSDLLGGDMLHIYRLSETKVACYVLDVSGHGTQASLLSVTIRNQLTSSLIGDEIYHTPGNLISLSSTDTSPLAVITELAQHYNDLLERTGQYFTIVYGILDVETGEFRFISAGHYNPVLISGDTVTIPSTTSGTPIGMFRDQSYTVQKLKVSRGDSLYLFTDGIVEETNTSGEQLGLKRLTGELLKMKKENRTMDHIMNQLSAWAGTESFKDDIAMVEINSRK